MLAPAAGVGITCGCGLNTTYQEGLQGDKKLFYIQWKIYRAARLAKILHSKVLNGKEPSRGRITVIPTPHMYNQVGGGTAITVQGSKQRLRTSTSESPGTERNSKSSAKQTASKVGDWVEKQACGLSHRCRSTVLLHSVGSTNLQLLATTMYGKYTSFLFPSSYCFLIYALHTHVSTSMFTQITYTPIREIMYLSISQIVCTSELMQKMKLSNSISFKQNSSLL